MTTKRIIQGVRRAAARLEAEERALLRSLGKIRAAREQLAALPDKLASPTRAGSRQVGTVAGRRKAAVESERVFRRLPDSFDLTTLRRRRIPGIKIAHWTRRGWIESLGDHYRKVR